MTIFANRIKRPACHQAMAFEALSFDSIPPPPPPPPPCSELKP